MTDQHARSLALRALHDRDAPVLRLLNAWDAGSAKVLVAAGAPALGTTSAGVAFALGLSDGEQLTRGAMLAAVSAITDAVAVPVSADLEAGADGLFVPGATDPGLLGRLVAATPLPLNVLAGPALPPVDELARLGVARVSSGFGPARLAFSAAYTAAQELLGSPGTYGDGDGLSYADVNRIMGGS